MLIPYQATVPMQRYPWANLALIALTVIVSLVAIWQPQFQQDLMLGQRQIPQCFRNLPPAVSSLLRDHHSSFPVEFRTLGYVTHGFVHAGYIHLIGNMLFLFVFGNAVNAKLGHLQYVALYLLIMAAAAMVQVHNVPLPSVGASGAIYGVLGLFIIFYPRNDISCTWFAFYRLHEHVGTFEVSSIWIVLYWVTFDVLILKLDLAGNVGVYAHLTGFAVGAGIGLLLVLTGLIQSDRYEQNLVELLRRKPK